jgi:hypothetical protein
MLTPDITERRRGSAHATPNAITASSSQRP